MNMEKAPAASDAFHQMHVFNGHREGKSKKCVKTKQLKIRFGGG